MRQRFWLAVGTPENWHTAFDYGGIWGLRHSQSRYWQEMAENSDFVFFYATRPIFGVVGHGIVRTKLQQNSPLWPDERARNRIIWPLRFEFDVLSCLAPASWREQRVQVDELRARVRSGFQGLEKEIAQQLLQALPGSLPTESLVVDLRRLQPRPSQDSARIIAGEATDLHKQTQLLLADIGSLQKYVTEMECPLESKRLDVVWRRVQRLVPSYVFEVQVSGNLTDAMGKLKQAFELWNSNIFLVGKEEHAGSIAELTRTTFHEIQDRLRFLELSQVRELYEKKRAYHEFENRLGIFGWVQPAASCSSRAAHS